MGNWQLGITLTITITLFFLLMRIVTYRFGLKIWLKKKVQVFGLMVSTSCYEKHKNIKTVWGDILDTFISVAVEEIMFRGPLVLLVALRIEAKRLIIPLIVTSLLFGLIHLSEKIFFEQAEVRYPWFVILETIIGGFGLGILALATHSLIYPILSHFFFNMAYNIAPYRDFCVKPLVVYTNPDIKRSEIQRSKQ